MPMAESPTEFEPLDQNCIEVGGRGHGICFDHPRGIAGKVARILGFEIPL